MKQETIQKIYTWAISIFITACLVAGALYYAHEPVEEPVGTELEQTLKAPKEKIISNETVSVKECAKYETTATSSQRCASYKIVEKVKYLYTDVEVPQYENEDISKRTKNSLFFEGDLLGSNEDSFGSNDGVQTMVSYLGEPFYEDSGKWYQTETAYAEPEVFEAAMGYPPRVIVETFFKSAVAACGTSGDPCFAEAGDGHIGNGAYATWDTNHDATTGSEVEPTNATWGGYGHFKSGANYQIFRSFLPFDTTALPDAAVISAATIDIYANEVNGSAPGIVVLSTQPDPNTFTSAEFDAWQAIDQPDEGSDTVQESDDQYNTFTLNATGMGWIQTATITPMGIRSQADVDDAEPGATGYVMHNWSEAAGTDTDPKITITFTEAAPEPDSGSQEIIWFD